jgi:hypothetical protein
VSSDPRLCVSHRRMPPDQGLPRSFVDSVAWRAMGALARQFCKGYFTGSSGHWK